MPIDSEEEMTLLETLVQLTRRLVNKSVSRGWSKTGTIIRGAGDNGQYSAQASFSGSGAQYYTVQFSIPIPPSDGIFNPIAEVIFSIGGCDVRRIINCGNGVAISGLAEVVHVKVYDITPVASYGVAATTYRVDTLIAKGSRPSTGIPPRYTTGDVASTFKQIAGVGTTTVTIPQNTGDMSVLVLVADNTGPVIPGDSTVTCQVAGTFLGLPFNYPALMWDPVVNTGYVPLYPGAINLQLENNSAKTLYYSVMYGIEG